MRTVAVIACLVSIRDTWATYVIDADKPEFNSPNEFWSYLEQDAGSFDLINFVKAADFPIEEHKVFTEDGYILCVHRIPHGSNNNDNYSRPVVLLMPGIFATSTMYVITGSERSLAMQLANQGYDVWMGNNRGTTYSRNHETLDPDKDKEYWNYSFQELGTKDLPAIIDYVLGSTRRKNLTYIGYSQGTTEVFVLLSDKPEYNEKLVLVNALAPVTYVNNLQSPIIRLLGDNFIPLELISKALGLTELFGHSSHQTSVMNLLCNPKSLDICPFLIFLLVGFDYEQLDRDALQILLQSFPGGSSVKTLIHFGQEYKSGNFKYFDHGIIGNKKTYGTFGAPDFNISKIAAPVALYYGQNDWITSVKDVERLADELTNLVRKQKIALKRFNHFDFIISKNVHDLLYCDVINFINSYNGKPNLTSPISTSATVF